MPSKPVIIFPGQGNLDAKDLAKLVKIFKKYFPLGGLEGNIISPLYRQTNQFIIDHNIAGVTNLFDYLSTPLLHTSVFDSIYTNTDNKPLDIYAYSAGSLPALHLANHLAKSNPDLPINLVAIGRKPQLLSNCRLPKNVKVVYVFQFSDIGTKESHAEFKTRIALLKGGDTTCEKLIIHQIDKNSLCLVLPDKLVDESNPPDIKHLNYFSHSPSHTLQTLQVNGLIEKIIDPFFSGSLDITSIKFPHIQFPPQDYFNLWKGVSTDETRSVYTDILHRNVEIFGDRPIKSVGTPLTGYNSDINVGKPKPPSSKLQLAIVGQSPEQKVFNSR